MFRTSMNLIPSAHQVAGHDGYLTAGAVFAKRSSPQEVAFYTETQARLSADPDAHMGSILGHWMPTFMGTLVEGAQNMELASAASEEDARILQTAHSSQVDLAAGSAPYLVISNLYHGFSKPCILDIKLGSVLTDESVTEEKRVRLQKVSDSTTSGSLSFRICGMKIFGSSASKPVSFFPTMEETVSEEASDDGIYFSFDRMFGRALTEDNVAHALDCFFVPGLPLRKPLLVRFHQRLQLLFNCLLDTEVRIKSGSLLFLYEGDHTRWSHLQEDTYFSSDPLLLDPIDYSDSDDDEEVNAKSSSAPLSRLNMIDFAHAKYTDGQGPDENIIVGVENLIHLFEKLIEKSA